MATSSEISTKVVVNVITALVLGVIALIGTWAFGGDIIRILGGVTVAEFQKATTFNLVDHEFKSNPAATTGVWNVIPGNGDFCFVPFP
jgi:hypothetical protein